MRIQFYQVRHNSNLKIEELSIEARKILDQLKKSLI